MEKARALETACEYLAQPFYAFVVFQRTLLGRETPENWKIEEENSEEIDRLRRAGQSFIIASGHFARHAIIVLYLHRTAPARLLASLGPLPHFRWRAATIRVRIQYGQMLRMLRHVRSDAQFVFAGASSAGRTLLGHFKHPGAIAIVTADAFWQDSSSRSVTRPFTAHLSHRFATGAATLGRLVQCPVVPCAPYVRADGTIVLRWGPSIPPPPATDKEADIRNTNAIIDFLETEVGLRPTQYALYIGESRRWSNTTKRWEAL